MDTNKNYSKVLLMTANLGSIFEEPDRMLVIWFAEFLSTVTRLGPDFIALHCQEVGGKNYEDTMQHVDKFTKMLLHHEGMDQYRRAHIFLDEDFTAVEKFTALGSLYFIHNSIRDVQIYNFYDKEFIPAEGKEVFTGNIENVHIKEKAKFPKDFFPDGVWSRKGYIRTRWRLCNTIFDLVNLHLFHDASNIVAMEKSPSLYSSHREQALLHTIKRFEDDEYPKAPYFIFGDYNFRLDTHKLVKNLTVDTEEVKEKKKNSETIVSSITYTDKSTNTMVLKVGKKEFKLKQGDDLFSNPAKFQFLRQFDTEPDACKLKLYEYPVTFPPSYPFSEDANEGTSYMPTRCPGWCDRIMMSHDARNIISNDKDTEYLMIGRSVCTGDHKPIILNLKIHKSQTPGMRPNNLSANIIDQHAMKKQGAIFNKNLDNEVKFTVDGEGNDERVGVWISADSDDDKPKRSRDENALLSTPRHNWVTINGEIFDLNDETLNIHKNIQFEFEDLVTEKFMKSINRIKAQPNVLKTSHSSEPISKLPATADAVTSRNYLTGPSLNPLVRSTNSSPRLKHARSFKEVVSSVLKSESILRYMKRFKHRSDSESEEDDEDSSSGNNGSNNGNRDPTNINNLSTGVDKNHKKSRSPGFNRKAKSLHVGYKSYSSPVDPEFNEDTRGNKNEIDNNGSKSNDVNLNNNIASNDLKSDKNKNKLKFEPKEKKEKRRGCKMQ